MIKHSIVRSFVAFAARFLTTINDVQTSCAMCSKIMLTYETAAILIVYLHFQNWNHFVVSALDEYYFLSVTLFGDVLALKSCHRRNSSLNQRTATFNLTELLQFKSKNRNFYRTADFNYVWKFLVSDVTYSVSWVSFIF